MRSICRYKGEYWRGQEKGRPCECLAACRKTFALPDSPGTIRHSQNKELQTDFKGCQPLEDKLQQSKLVAYYTSESRFGTRLVDSDDDETGVIDNIDALNPLDFHYLVEEADEEGRKLPSLGMLFIWRQGKKEQNVGKRRRSSQRFKELWQGLTEKQRYAATHFALRNPRRLSLARVAAKAGVNHHTFKDHCLLSSKRRRSFIQRKRRQKIQDE